MPKVMSTLTTAILCYLNDEKTWEASKKTFSEQSYETRYTVTIYPKVLKNCFSLDSVEQI